MAAAETAEALSAAYFYVKLDDLDTVAFREISGIASENEVIVQHQTTAEGKPVYVKVPGRLTWQNLVLKKGIDSDMSLWTWRNTIITQGVDGQRKNGTIYVVDVQGKQKTTWSIVNAWPCNYIVGALVPNTNEMLLEEIHLAHEGITRAQ
jgi:phage tail-like protein